MLKNNKKKKLWSRKVLIRFFYSAVAETLTAKMRFKYFIIILRLLDWCYFLFSKISLAACKINARYLYKLKRMENILVILTLNTTTLRLKTLYYLNHNYETRNFVIYRHHNIMQFFFFIFSF